MKFDYKQKIHVKNIAYIVIGYMVFRDKEDGSIWTEYRLESLNGNEEKWLSIDNKYEEYSIFTMIYGKPNLSRYHVADTGRAVVVSAVGDVDVERGDAVSYKEYEDNIDEKIISVESWDDETEYSSGYYLKKDDIKVLDHDNRDITDQYDEEQYYDYSFGSYSGNSVDQETLEKAVTCIVCVIIFIILVASLGNSGYHHNSVRQYSHGSRYSSGGGLSSGK